MLRAAAWRAPRWVALVALSAGCAASALEAPDYRGVPTWSSRAIPEARGEMRTQADGKRVAVRYPGWTTRDFDRAATYAYNDQRSEPAVQRVTMPAGLAGDASQGRALFLNPRQRPPLASHPLPGHPL